MAIDIEGDVPTGKVGQTEFETLSEHDPGMADYLDIFGVQWALKAGMNREQFDDRPACMKPMILRWLIAERSIDTAMKSKQFIALLHAASIYAVFIGTGKHAAAKHTLELASQHPERVVPSARINATEGETGVKGRGLRGLEIFCFREKQYASDMAATRSTKNV